ncbi:caspase-7-like [Arctopsyche grandis]|uniref:caspase-7-like n=1 Tax=Arctopsyche grandis TaxID=121162 RepID=UPI00406D67FD
MVEIDHKAFAVCMMGHANENIFYDINGRATQIESIKNAMFHSEKSRVKPLLKLLIFQACRGNNVIDTGMSPIDIETDSMVSEEYQLGPISQKMRDLLVVFSSAEGYVSFRSTNFGSPLITSLCKNVVRFGNSMHLQDIMMHVLKDVGKWFPTQAPEFLSSCTSAFFLRKTNEQASIIDGWSDHLDEERNMHIPEDLHPICSEIYTKFNEYIVNGGDANLMLDRLSIRYL